MKNTQGKLEWFGGRQDALDMFRLFADLAHIWDDIVDKDKDVNEEDINYAFLIALVYLPSNPFYKSIQTQIMPMWISVVHAFQTANFFEKNKDEHGIEIAHNLRYTAGNIISYAMHLCLTPEDCKKFVPEMWKCVVSERFDAYRKEHLND